MYASDRLWPPTDIITVSQGLHWWDREEGKCSTTEGGSEGEKQR